MLSYRSRPGVCCKTLTDSLSLIELVCFRFIPSLKLTWPLKMDGWNTTFLLGRPIFRGYVSFREVDFWNPSRHIYQRGQDFGQSEKRMKHEAFHAEWLTPNGRETNFYNVYCWISINYSILFNYSIWVLFYINRYAGRNTYVCTPPAKWTT